MINNIYILIICILWFIQSFSGFLDVGVATVLPTPHPTWLSTGMSPSPSAMVEPSVGTASPPGHVSAIFRYLMIPWIPPIRSFLAVFQSIQWSINYLFHVHQDCDVRVSGQFTSWIHLYLFQSWFYHDICSLCRSLQLVNRNPNSHVFPKHSKSWSYGPQNHEDAKMRAAKIARTKSQSDKSVRANLVPGDSRFPRRTVFAGRTAHAQSCGNSRGLTPVG